jgi:hypothetical protein
MTHPESAASDARAATPASLAPELRTAVIEAAKSIRAHYSEGLTDPHSPGRCARLFQKIIGKNRRRRGAPRKDEVTLALWWEHNGVSRPEIYSRLGKQTRPEQAGLREAMRQRRKRRREQIERARGEEAHKSTQKS